MSLKDFFRPIIWDARHSHIYVGFILSGFMGIMLPHPIPVSCVLILAMIRESLQQLSWPYKHEKQSFHQMLNDVTEFVGGASVASILDACLRYLI